MLEKDISDNRSIGEFGAKAILNNVTDGEQVRVLTHCNTGSLATAYFGTALGVVRCLHSASRLGKVFKCIFIFISHRYCTTTFLIQIIKYKLIY